MTIIAGHSNPGGGGIAKIGTVCSGSHGGEAKSSIVSYYADPARFAVVSSFTTDFVLCILDYLIFMNT